MKTSGKNLVAPLLARTDSPELAQQAKGCAEKIIPGIGEPYVALMDAQRRDYYRQIKQEHIHLLLIGEIDQGMNDVAAGRVKDARATLVALRQTRHR